MSRIPFTPDNPKGFNAATFAVIDFLKGDRRTGMCLCPIHDDHNPSLSVSSGDKVAVVVHCFGCGNDAAVIDHLRANGVWPTSGKLTGAQASLAAEEARSPEERRRYAVSIWNALNRGRGHELAFLLRDYTATRALNRVPPEARITLAPALLQARDNRNKMLGSHDPGMVLAFRDKTGRFSGIQTLWLNGDLTGKREKEPQRQTSGRSKCGPRIRFRRPADTPPRI
jgi:hypothetical protein